MRGLLIILLAVILPRVDYNVIPQPQRVEMTAAKPFVLDKSVKVYYETGLQTESDFLRTYIKDMTGIMLRQSCASYSDKGIVLRINTDIEGEEAYRISVSKRCVLLEGRTSAGVFYAVQTLRKSLPIGTFSAVELPSGVVNDSPRYAYRGGMLDVARHFFDVEFVKTFIDILALHNCNVFHWHLTDDQGWRVQVDKYPLLTEVGSHRAQTLVGRHDKGIYDGIPHGGWYTKEQLREVVEYAAARHIEVVPEIDMPGHMVSALASYPDLGCSGGPYKVREKWDIADEVLCVGNDKTMRFVEDVIDEICEIFPSRFIHIGGDECPKTAWKACPKCQARIRQLGFQDSEQPEEALQNWFTRHMSEYIAAKGRSIIGWDEVLEGGSLNKNDVIMSWRGEKGAVKAASQGLRTIITAHHVLYFDRYQTVQTKDREPLAFGGCAPIDKVYAYNPDNNKQLTAQMRQYVMGCQANLWGEFISTPEYAEHMFLPRAAALAEVTWCHVEQKDYDHFLGKLNKMAAIYGLYNWNYAKYVFEDQKR